MIMKILFLVFVGFVAVMDYCLLAAAKERDKQERAYWQSQMKNKTGKVGDEYGESKEILLAETE